MKNPTPRLLQMLSFRDAQGVHSRISVRRLLLLAGCVGLGVSRAPAQSTEANIGVRTKVTDHWVRPKGKEPADGGHSKIFGLLAVEEIKSDQRLVKPVEVPYLKSVLLRELAANGFRPFAPGQKPDILLTVSYGRGELANPYMSGQGEVGGGGLAIPVNVTGGGDAGNAPTQTLTGAVDIGQAVFDSKTPGHEAKLQKASFEKLFIRVTAWAYPKDANTKPRMLWKTVIVADDPDNTDLNAIAADMLAAGAPLFDKESREKEVDLYKPLPNGRVEVGIPEVVEPTGAKSK